MIISVNTTSSPT
uniref:Uncharacterized protein n=1 Tax=Anguilla anguilla TaxID=7936 RepID=A0A0E9T3Q0_ANGAN